MTATYATVAQLQRYLNLSGTAEFSTQQYQDALDAAEEEINRETNTVFVDGTATTPNWTKKTNESHTGKGTKDKRYFLENYPIPDVSTTVNGTAITAGDTTVYVQSTNGFPSSGSISIENDRIDYTGKSGSAFTGCTSVSAHGTAETVRPYVIEISTTAEGQTTSWTVMEYDKDYDIDLNTGRIYLNDSSLESNASNTVAFSRFPSYQIANRFRATYISGVDSIPKDIERLCIKIAARDLRHSTVNKAHIHGVDDFDPTPVNVDDTWIEKTLNRYRKNKFQLI